MSNDRKRMLAMGQRPPARARLTPALCRRQTTEVVIENYEAAMRLLELHRQQPRKVTFSTLARARRQRAICYNELIRRGHDREALEYVPPTKANAEEETRCEESKT